MAINDVCRLCLATDDLVYIFDNENKKLKMNDIISITTGIEIHAKDIISQKICQKCYKFSIKIFHFRGQCLKADKYLKGLCMDYLVENKYYIPNTEVTIKSVVKSEENFKLEPFKPSSTYKVHPSVVRLSLKYPEMKLPKICLTSDVTPCVEMELNLVENYYKRLNSNFDFSVKNALHSNRKDFQQNKMVTEPKVGNKEIVEVNETKNSTKDPCKTPKKVTALENNLKSPSRTNAKRKLSALSPNSEVPNKTINCQNSAKSTTSPMDQIKHVTKAQRITDDLGQEFIKSPISKNRQISVENIVDNEKGEGKMSPKVDIDCLNSPIRKKRRTRNNSNMKNDEESTNIPKTISKHHPIQRFTHDALRDTLNERSTVLINNNGCDLHCSNSNIPMINKEESEKVENESLTNVGRSVPLLVCEICNSVHYSMFDLKRHRFTHLRCQFCKIRLRSLKNKKHHIENVCVIKKMMQDLPLVMVGKIEYNRAVRCRYKDTFNGFSELPEENAILTKQNVPNLKNFVKDFSPERSDIIEILSDDDVSLSPINKKGEFPLVLDLSSDILSNVDLAAPTKEVVNNVISMFQRRSKEAETQTNLPTSNDTVVSERNQAKIKNLIPYLAMYRIPIKLLPGKFNVAIDHNLPLKTRTLCFWDDLTPVNVIPTTKNMTSVIAIEGQNANTQIENKEEDAVKS